MEVDLFPSAEELCTISPSQEELLRRIGFARKHHSDDESQEQPLGTAVESVGIVMVSPPDSAQDEERQDVYHTPPEEAAAQSSDGGDTVAADWERTEGQRAVDLGRDTDLGFSTECTATERVLGGNSQSQVGASGSDSQKARVPKRVSDSGENLKQSFAKKVTGDKGSALETTSSRNTVSTEKVEENLKLVDRNKDFDESRAKSLKILDDKTREDLVIHSADGCLIESPRGRLNIRDVNQGIDTPNAPIEIVSEKLIKSLEKCVEELKSYGLNDKYKVKFHSGSSAKRKLDLSVELILQAANIIDAEVEKSHDVLEAVEGVERDGTVRNSPGPTVEKDENNREVDRGDRVHRDDRREQISRSIDDIEKFKFTGSTVRSKGKEVVGDVRNQVMDKHLSKKEACNGNGGQVQMSRKRARGVVEDVGSILGESSEVGRGMWRLPKSIQGPPMGMKNGLDSRKLPEPIQQPAMDAEKGIDSSNLPSTAPREVTLLDVLKWIAGPCKEDKNIAKMNVLDVARQCGIVFPQPRWWPEEGS